jgi:hypothetical protein
MAMHTYHDVHGRLPAAAVCGKDGKPLLSWRVTILPYLEKMELYEQFKLDEPWDSPHNIRLLSEIPDVYAPPPGKKSKVPPDHTVCHVFVGNGTAFEGHDGLRLSDDFPDGTFNTLLLVEAGEPVPWTKPEDLTYDPAGPLPELRCIFKDGFRAQMVSFAGSRRERANRFCVRQSRATAARKCVWIGEHGPPIAFHFSRPPQQRFAMPHSIS